MVVRKYNCRELEAMGVRGGHGAAFSTLLAKGARKSLLRALALNRLPSGHSWGLKKHKHEEEFFFIVSGTAEVVDDGEKHTLGAGDLLYAEPGRVIAIRNAGEEELVFLAGMIQQPLGVYL